MGDVIELEILDGPFGIRGRGMLYVVVAPVGVKKAAEMVGREYIVQGARRKATGSQAFSPRASFPGNRVCGVGVLFGPPLEPSEEYLRKTAERRRNSNQCRLNDMYAGAVMEPFASDLERWEFEQNWPNNPEAKRPRPEEP